MSTEQRTHFIHGKKSQEEGNVSQSALFYLFQEVSKLAPSAQSSFHHQEPPLKWPDEVQGKDSTHEEQNVRLIQTSKPSLMLPFSQVKEGKEQTGGGKTPLSAEPRGESHSPWKVLSLINLHCEKLLYQKQGEFSHRSNTKLINSTTSLSPAVRSEGVGTESTSLPPERRRDDVTDECSGDSEPEAAERTHTDGALENDAPASSQPQSGFVREGRLSASRRLERNQTLSQPALLQTHTRLIFNENDQAPAALHKPSVTLDNNANILSTEPPSDHQPSPLTSKQPLNPTASDATLLPPHQQTASVSQQRSFSSTSSLKEIWEQRNKNVVLPSTWKSKTPRKQLHPCRSADDHDPDFQGVTFRMDTQLDDTREQCRLCITSKYSTELRKSTRKPRLRTRTSRKLLKTSSSEDENEPTANAPKSVKVCASCCTRKTPMWRDAEDGTPLCNACGIRYKKYRVRCVSCWHIPRKEGNSNSHCLKCGKFVKLSSTQRKHSS